MVTMLNYLNLKEEDGNENDRRYVLILLLLFVLAFSLRVTNLTILEPYTDEYTHLIGAKALMTHGSTEHAYNWDTRTYLRAFPLTYSIGFLFKLFGDSLFIARLPGVLFGALTVIPFYLMFRGTNRAIGLIAAGLWAISPWAIAVSRTVREYAIFPFFYIFIFIFLVRLRNIILGYLEHRHKINLPRLALYGVVFALPLIYAAIDRYSTFKQIVLLYFAFALYLLFGIFRSGQISPRVKKGMGFIAAGTLIALYASLPSNLGAISILPLVDLFFVDLIFNNYVTQWYGDNGAIGFYAIFAAGVLAAVYSLLKQKFHIVGFALLSFATYLYFFTFHFAWYNKPRYGFSIHIWLIPLIAVGVFLMAGAIILYTT